MSQITPTLSIYICMCLGVYCTIRNFVTGLSLLSLVEYVSPGWCEED